MRSHSQTLDAVKAMISVSMTDDSTSRAHNLALTTVHTVDFAERQPHGERPSNPRFAKLSTRMPWISEQNPGMFMINSAKHPCPK